MSEMFIEYGESLEDYKKKMEENLKKKNEEMHARKLVEMRNAFVMTAFNGLCANPNVVGVVLSGGTQYRVINDSIRIGNLMADIYIEQLTSSGEIEKL